jgi:hypothetical protein
LPVHAASQKLDAEYVLPLRWEDDAAEPGLTAYLGVISQFVDITVVDGSRQELFTRHARRWQALARHVAPQAWPGANGKVAGVMTGLRSARHEHVIIADDDVRYDRDSLAAVARALDDFELVRPQNYFTQLPWHARWDTGRSLLNRAFGSDYPGTLGVRRDVVLGANGYRGDVLFENLELIRTVRASGGRELRADGLYVARDAPTPREFWKQRIRQAYDDFAQPARLGVELAILPLSALALRRPGRLLLAAVLTCAVAEVGRRKHGGSRAFSATAALWAPLWVAERAVCVWLALGSRAAGGVRYRGARIRTAATPLRLLQSRLAEKS